MTDRTYPRPAGNLDALLDALHEAGADAGVVGTGNPDLIGISVEGATAEEIDAIWERAMRGLSLLDLARLDQDAGLLATLATMEPLSDEDALPDVDEPPLREMLREAYMAGVDSTGQGWNGEHPGDDESRAHFQKRADEYAAKIMGGQG